MSEQETIRRGRLPVPASLAALLGAVLVLGVAWTLFVPPWQAPDENSHFAYAQTLAELHRLPGAEGPIFSTEQVLAADRSNADQAAAQLAVKPEWSRRVYEQWQQAEARLPHTARSDGGGPVPSRTNPPLYYAYETPAYWAASGGDIFDRLYSMRLWSVLLLLPTTAATWLLAGEVFGKRRPLQLAAAAVVGLQPMEMFISASVNPDAMLFPLWAAALWLGVGILKRGLSLGPGLAICVTVAAAILVKATSYALLPGLALVLAIGFWRSPYRSSAKVAATVAAVLALAIPVGTWIVAARSSNRPVVNQVGSSQTTVHTADLRGFASYVWQYYLPALPFQTRYGPLPGLPAKQFWVDGTWDSFGWLEVRFPIWVNRLFLAISFLTFAAAGVALLLRRIRIPLVVLLFFLAVAGALVAGLHWVSYQAFVETGAPFLQGRYLLPLLPLCGLAVAVVLTLVPDRWREVSVGGLVGGLFVLQLLSLELVAQRFYV